jgi:WD40-like Beta Propeller Repeat
MTVAPRWKRGRPARSPALVASALLIVASTCGGAGVAGTDSRAELTFTRVNGQRYSVWVANADGSAARKIVSRAYGGALSADGRWLAFSRPQDAPNSARVPLYVVGLSGGKPSQIGEVRSWEWSPRRAELAIVDAAGLVRVDPALGTRRLLVSGRDLLHISFSPDGRAVAYAQSNGRVGKAYRNDIFTVRISDGVTTRLTRDGHSTHPLWGPDWIVYQRLRWAGGIAPLGRLWLMRPDGSGKRFFVRGAEGLRSGFPVFGLDPLALSEDGRHLLACQTFEFGCPRVTLTVPGGKRYGFPKLRPLEQARGASALDLSPDGTRVLVDVGSPHDDRHHAVYEIPFAGGRLRLIAADAIAADWRH